MKPQPKYGWRGQTNQTDGFPIGTKVYITGGFGHQVNDALAEVIEFGTPPMILKDYPDLVHLRIIEPNDTFYKGMEEYWQEWQLELTND